jgi:hypothetical protein
MVLTSLLDTAAAEFPLKIALVFENKSYTYAWNRTILPDVWSLGI